MNAIGKIPETSHSVIIPNLTDATHLPSVENDIHPLLVKMKSEINATSYFVLSVGFDSRLRKVRARRVVVDEKNANENVESCDECDQMLVEHLDNSPLAAVWNRQNSAGGSVALEYSSMITKIEMGDDCGAGIAFPIRLGGIGNGLVVFRGDDIVINGDALIDIHRQCQSIMTALLRIEVCKTVPRMDLSDREISCLQLAGNGMRSDVIAVELGLSVHTVNAYLGSAAAKLDCVNRIQAIAKAIRLGFIN